MFFKSRKARQREKEAEALAALEAKFDRLKNGRSEHTAFELENLAKDAEKVNGGADLAERCRRLAAAIRADLKAIERTEMGREAEIDRKRREELTLQASMGIAKGRKTPRPNLGLDDLQGRLTNEQAGLRLEL